MSEKENEWTVLTLNEEPKTQTDGAAPTPQPRPEAPRPAPPASSQAPLYPPAGKDLFLQLLGDL